MQELLYRVTKGEELTDLELDDNFRKLRAAIVALQAQVGNQGGGGGTVPVATVLPFAGVALPTGFLFPNGQAVSRTTYDALYAALGGGSSPFGQGDGVTTFNLPYLNGRTIMFNNPMGGVNNVGLSARAMGDLIGSETASFSHQHNFSVVIPQQSITFTPAGNVTVNQFSGSVSVPIAINTDTAILGFTPSGTVDFSSIDNHTDVIEETSPGHKHTLTETPVDITPPLEPSGVQVVEYAIQETDAEQVSITLDLQHSGTGILAGDAVNLNHSHGVNTTLSIPLTHTHTASFAGIPLTVAIPSQTVNNATGSSSASGSVIPPALCLNAIIKY